MWIDIGARTDLGCVRELNEDCYRILPELNLFIVSDGIGGEAHGEVASLMAVDTIAAHCQEATKNSSLPLEGEARHDLSHTANRLASAVRRANQAIHSAATNNPELGGMGATVVALWLNQRRFSLTHVGDSRAYRLRSDKLERLTRDHSLVAEQVRLGILTEEQADSSELQTVLVRALGASADVEVDVDEHLLADGDLVLLCSDGLSRTVPDNVIAQTIQTLRPAQKAVDQLVQLAREAGGPDNITVLLLRFELPSKGLLDRLLTRRGHREE